MRRGPTGSYVWAMTKGDLSEICRRDRRGRVLSTARQRQAVLEEYGRSGLSGPAFARAAGIKYQTFACWRVQHRKSSSGMVVQPGPRQVSGTVSFLEANGPPAHGVAQAGAALRIALPGGATLMLAEVAQVPLAVQLLQALRVSC